MGSEGSRVRRVAEISRASLVDGNATRLLRKSVATPIAKLENVTVTTDESNKGGNYCYR